MRCDGEKDEDEDDDVVWFNKMQQQNLFYI